MFDKDFYPTPKEVIKEAFKKADELINSNGGETN